MLGAVLHNLKYNCAGCEAPELSFHRGIWTIYVLFLSVLFYCKTTSKDMSEEATARYTVCSVDARCTVRVLLKNNPLENPLGFIKVK